METSGAPLAERPAVRPVVTRLRVPASDDPPRPSCPANVEKGVGGEEEAEVRSLSARPPLDVHGPRW